MNAILCFRQANRGGHTLVFGTTGVGKTRFAEVLVTQDIHRGKTPEEREVVVFFDPKGDPDMLKRMYAEAKRAGRENDFMYSIQGIRKFLLDITQLVASVEFLKWQDVFLGN